MTHAELNERIEATEAVIAELRQKVAKYEEAGDAGSRPAEWAREELQKRLARYHELLELAA